MWGQTRASLASFFPKRSGAMAASKGIGLDFGELDIIRDNADGGIYIIDVNKTPWGPPNHILPWQEDRCIEDLAGAFEESFLNGR